MRPRGIGLNEEKADVMIKVTNGKKKIGKGDAGDPGAIRGPYAPRTVLTS